MSHMMKASALKKSGSTNKNENYPSPVSLVRKRVKHLVSIWHNAQLRPLTDRSIRVLDIGAGNGVWGIIAKEELEKLNYTVHLVGIEIDITIEAAPEFDEWIQADFQEVRCAPFDVILSNPPFSLVYAVSKWAKENLYLFGVFGLLIGSNFMFAETYINRFLERVRPILEVKLTRRPSFKQIFSEMRGDTKGKGTSAKDYCFYVFAGLGIEDRFYKDQTSVKHLCIDEGVKIWATYSEYWDYDDDPLEAVLVERPVTVQQALIRDAAEAKDNELKWDFYWALMTVNMYGRDFYYSDTQERLDMIDHYITKHVDRESWGAVWEDVMESVYGDKVPALANISVENMKEEPRSNDHS